MMENNENLDKRDEVIGGNLYEFASKSIFMLSAKGKKVKELVFENCRLIGSSENFDYQDDSIHYMTLCLNYG